MSSTVEGTQSSPQSPALWLWVLLVVCVAAGIYFRFDGLGKKLYWHDECCTSILVGGHRQLDVARALFTGRPIAPQDLQRFQRIDPSTRWFDTVFESAVDDPKHPPLYFLAARLWASAFGDSPAGLRGLSAVLGVLALPCMAWLCLELFRSSVTAAAGAALMAVSPFSVLYSQEAREYELWIVLTLAASAMLLRAIRLDSRAWWRAYTACAIVGIYSYTLFAFVLASHVAFVIVGGVPRAQRWRLTRAAAATGVATLPLVAVIIARRRLLHDSTSWLFEPVARPYLLGRFVIGLATPFVDFVSMIEPEQMARPLLFSIPVLILLIVASADMFRRAPRRVTAFVICLAAFPIAALLLPDLIIGGRRSFPFRYHVPLYVAAQLCVVGFIGRLLIARHAAARAGAASLLVLLAGVGAASCVTSAGEISWWNKGNGQTGLLTAADTINRATDIPVIGNSIGTNFGDTIALSRYLDPNIRLILRAGAHLPNLPDAGGSAFFVSTDVSWARRLSRQYGSEIKEVVPNFLWLRRGAPPSNALDRLDHPHLGQSEDDERGQAHSPPE
jgi:uncharacterized membrane protein